MTEKQTPGLTDDPNDPQLTHGVDSERVPQAAKYLILSDAERKLGFIRPVRLSYQHLTCGAVTTMHRAIAETYARDPQHYGATFCVRCSRHLPVGVNGQFIWDDGSGEKVGT